MKAQDLIKELGTVLHLPNLSLNESNVCRVLFDGHAIDFEVLPGKDDLFLIAEVGPVPTDTACFRRMLEANRYGLETNGATLGIDPDREAVVLHRQLTISALDYPAFERCLEVFFERLKYWKGSYNVTPDNGVMFDFKDYSNQLLKI